MTATTENRMDRTVNRRDFMRGTAGAGVAALGIGATAQPTLAEEDDDEEDDGTGTWDVMGQEFRKEGVIGTKVKGLAYIGDRLSDLTGFIGNSDDVSGYTGADALRQHIATAAAEIRLAHEKVTTSIQNNIEGSENLALSKGKAAIIREMNAGNPEEEAQAAMEEAIDDYYAAIEENILNHYVTQFEQMSHHSRQLEEHADTSAHANEYRYDDAGTTWSGGFLSIKHDEVASEGDYSSSWYVDYTLYDGTVFENIPVMARHSGGYDRYGALTPRPEMLPDDCPSRSTVLEYPGAWRFDDEADGDDEEWSEIYFDYEDYWHLFDDVQDGRDNVYGQLSGFVSDVYAQWDADDIPTEDLVDPITATTELAMDFDHYAGTGAFAAFAGIPTQAAQALVLEVDPDGDANTIDADIYTNHVPTDADGNELGFEADGETVYEPAEWDEPLYIGYSYTETNEDGEIVDKEHNFAQLEDPFIVMEAFDADGEQVETFETRETNVQTSDVEALQDEIDQLRQEQIEMQNRAEEDMDDGGFVLPDFGIDGLGGIAGGVAVVFLLLGVLVQAAKSLHPAAR